MTTFLVVNERGASERYPNIDEAITHAGESEVVEWSTDDDGELRESLRTVHDSRPIHYRGGTNYDGHASCDRHLREDGETNARLSSDEDEVTCGFCRRWLAENPTVRS